ncbi:(2Fe-2S)-binding protein [Antrihabitans cavernicola]|uniref:(2Fe-2S)-binding protein n=1 Tax=Antrihabitans cavernicola TaxID=2495913 RepID=UPI0016593297|nr:(2Fe-2S)-binding protein [Spelaeibacter cavernicola]
MIAGTALADTRWLADRIADTARTWRHDDPRVIGTLWWYIVSSTMLEEPMRALVATGSAPDPALEALTCTVRPDGSLERVTSSGVVDGPSAFATALGASLHSIVTALASVSGAGEPSLWAIAADALGNRVLDASPTDHDRATELALTIADVIGDVMPTPRFVDVGNHRYVHRTSCCLIYLTGVADKCVSCPRRTPEERAGLLAARAGTGR